MTYKIVIEHSKPYWMETLTLTEDQLIPALEVRGFNLIGQHRSQHTRQELQGQPIFSGLCGPMWDGGPIRYENQAAYNTLSA